MTALWIGLGVAAFGTLCAFLLPRVWSRSTVAVSGPLISSVLVEGFDPHAQPQILLCPRRSTR